MWWYFKSFIIRGAGHHINGVNCLQIEASYALVLNQDGSALEEKIDDVSDNEDEEDKLE